MDYEKPMRTGHKQGKMQLNCFYLLAEIGIALASKQLCLLSCLHSEKQEHSFLLLYSHAPPHELLAHSVYYWV
jgi:hypothetical protein